MFVVIVVRVARDCGRNVRRFPSSLKREGVIIRLIKREYERGWGGGG